jgi:LAO/AO transport system kinase
MDGKGKLPLLAQVFPGVARDALEHPVADPGRAIAARAAQPDAAAPLAIPDLQVEAAQIGRAGIAHDREGGGHRIDRAALIGRVERQVLGAARRFVGLRQGHAAAERDLGAFRVVAADPFLAIEARHIAPAGHPACRIGDIGDLVEDPRQPRRDGPRAHPIVFALDRERIAQRADPDAPDMDGETAGFGAGAGRCGQPGGKGKGKQGRGQAAHRHLLWTIRQDQGHKPARNSRSGAMTDTAELANRIRAGDRRALARAITLIESTRPDHRAAATELLDRLAERGAGAMRIGLSGTPGVGKSTFIEAFGQMLTRIGLRVAVLAVDPSSTRSGGSILGDKTRMPELARDPNAFIRPSPSQTALGGVARRTREAIALCAAAGYDLVLVETVGVGQSETMVAQMTDLFVLLLAPAGGDELQGVKRGIMEIADLILVNKADGDLLAAARRTRADYAGALQLLRRRPQDPEGFPRALCVSAADGTGLDAAWEAMRALADWRRDSGVWAARRAEQARSWFADEVQAGLMARLAADAGLARMTEELGRAVAEGRASPTAAAAEVLATFDAKTGA